jgi:hypothetical protein
MPTHRIEHRRGDRRGGVVIEVDHRRGLVQIDVDGDA